MYTIVCPQKFPAQDEIPSIYGSELRPSKFGCPRFPPILPLPSYSGMLQWLILASPKSPAVLHISKHPLFIKIGSNHNEANLRKV